MSRSFAPLALIVTMAIASNFLFQILIGVSFWEFKPSMLVNQDEEGKAPVESVENPKKEAEVPDLNDELEDK